MSEKSDAIFTLVLLLAFWMLGFYGGYIYNEAQRVAQYRTESQALEQLGKDLSEIQQIVNEQYEIQQSDGAAR